jgi:ketosteroid isomerase-like protein
MLSTKRPESSRLVGNWLIGLESLDWGALMRPVTLLVAFVCATNLLVVGQDDSTAGVQSRIVALEKAWNQAYKTGDTKALDGILDDQIVLINDDGSVQNKAEFLRTVKKSDTQEQQVAPESMSVHVFGSTAIATGVFRAKGVEGGKPYVRRERFVDTWISKGGRWVCVATNATPVVH